MTSTTSQQLQTLTRLASEGLSFDSTTIHPYSGAMTVEADRKTLVMINAAGEITFDGRPQASDWNEDAHADLRAINALGMHRDLGGCAECQPQTDEPMTAKAELMPMLREIRQLLSDAPGSRTCSLQQDRESGDYCVQVSCGSDSTFSWVVNALNGAELNEHPTRRRTLQVFSIDHLEA